ncbi:hypothetical protein D9M69_474340 [compost metagenome]
MLRIIQKLVDRLPRQQPAITQLAGIVLFKELVQVGSDRPACIVAGQTQGITKTLFFDLVSTRRCPLGGLRTILPGKKSAEHQSLQNMSALFFTALKPRRSSAVLAAASSLASKTW